MSQLEINGSKVYVSRYSNKEINEEKYTPISISLGLPKFYISYKIADRIYSLAPGRDYFRASEEVFTEKYIEQLERMGVDRVVEIIGKFAEQGKDIVLLCFEDIDKDMCHRTLLANWIKEKKGLEVLELQDPSKKAKKEIASSRASQISFW